ncbi:MAG TPA: ATP-binding protein [Steroidobacteraceae bacterium]|nr:ATP-binding protein [Steroidobacteraceae bacterium]
MARLPRVFRTSSFRLTLLYAGLTGLSYLLLFAVVYFSTATSMERQIDASVAGELTEIQADAQSGGLARLREVVRELIGRSPDYFYLLQDASGTVLAGNLPATQPLPGVRQWSRSAHHPREAFSGLRGRGVGIADSAYLFVGLSTAQLHDMQQTVVRAFLWGLTLAILLAFAGGAMMSVSVLRRIEAVSQTSRDIVGGDLKRRIPGRGSGDEFDHLAESLNAMLDRIQTLMEGLRQVSNDIAHDLRTPLTRLRQRLELAQRRGDGGDHSEPVLEEALRDIDTILETFGALLRIAQIEGGARVAGFTALDLDELLRTVSEVYQPALDAKNQTLVLQIEPALQVRGDRELLTQLFANLLENAVRHPPPGAHVELRAQRRRSGVEVTVADNGPGIAPEFRQKVLQRFFRLEASRSTPGNGLGLSMVEAIARLHDGELALLDNEPGLKVSVTLRAAKAQ